MAAIFILRGLFFLLFRLIHALTASIACSLLVFERGTLHEFTRFENDGTAFSCPFTPFQFFVWVTTI